MPVYRNGRYSTWVIRPPAETITRAVAIRWLHRDYKPLSRLLSIGNHPDYMLLVRGIGLRKGERPRAICGMSLVDSDVRTITEVCGRVLGTGRPERMVYDPNALGDHASVARKLRALLKYELRHPQRGTRLILRRAIRDREQLARKRKLSPGGAA